MGTGTSRSHFGNVLDLNCAGRNTQCTRGHEISRDVLTYLRIDGFENRRQLINKVQQLFIGGNNALRSQPASMPQELQEALGIVVGAFNCRIDVCEQPAPRFKQLGILGRVLQCDRGSLRGTGRSQCQCDRTRCSGSGSPVVRTQIPKEIF